MGGEKGAGGRGEGRGGEGWSGVSLGWGTHLPYGCGAAPYLGSAKRGAGLPFPVASFLCALDPVKKKKEKNHLNYTIHRLSWTIEASKTFLLRNRSTDIDRGIFFFFFSSSFSRFVSFPFPFPLSLPLSFPRFPFIEIAHDNEQGTGYFIPACTARLVEAQFVSPNWIARHSIYELNRFSSRLAARNRRTNPE